MVQILIKKLELEWFWLPNGHPISLMCSWSYVVTEYVTEIVASLDF